MSQMKLHFGDEQPSRSVWAQIAWAVSILLAIVCVGAGFVSLHFGFQPILAGAEFVCGFAIILVLTRATMRYMRRSGEKEEAPAEEAQG